MRLLGSLFSCFQRDAARGRALRCLEVPCFVCRDKIPSAHQAHNPSRLPCWKRARSGSRWQRAVSPSSPSAPLMLPERGDAAGVGEPRAAISVPGASSSTSRAAAAGNPCGSFPLTRCVAAAPAAPGPTGSVPRGGSAAARRSHGPSPAEATAVRGHDASRPETRLAGQPPYLGQAVCPLTSEPVHGLPRPNELRRGANPLRVRRGGAEAAAGSLLGLGCSGPLRARGRRAARPAGGVPLALTRGRRQGHVRAGGGRGRGDGVARVRRVRLLHGSGCGAGGCPRLRGPARAPRRHQSGDGGGRPGRAPARRGRRRRQHPRARGGSVPAWIRRLGGRAAAGACARPCARVSACLRVCACPTPHAHALRSRTLQRPPAAPSPADPRARRGPGRPPQRRDAGGGPRALPAPGRGPAELPAQSPAGPGGRAAEPCTRSPGLGTPPGGTPALPVSMAMVRERCRLPADEAPGRGSPATVPLPPASPGSRGAGGGVPPGSRPPRRGSGVGGSSVGSPARFPIPFGPGIARCPATAAPQGQAQSRPAAENTNLGPASTRRGCGG